MKHRKVLFVLAAGALAAPLLAINGAAPVKAEGETTTYLEKTFTTDGIADAKAASNIEVQAAGGEFAGVKPTDGAQVSYITYEVKTSDASKTFATMSLSLNEGRFAYYSGDFGVNFDVYVSDSETLPSTKAYTVAATSSPLNTLTVNLDEAVSAFNAPTLYVSFGFSPKNPGCGYDSTWTIFNKLAITGTEVAPTPSDVIKHTVSDNWRQGDGTGSLPGDSSTYKANRIYNIGGVGNATHGAIVGTWGGSLSVSKGENGWVEYKLGADDEILQSASFTFVAKFNNMSNDDIHSGDRLFVKASATGEDADFENHIIAKYCHFDEEGWINAGNSDEYTQTIDLSDFISGLGKTKYIYVRFQMMHYIALSNVELNLWGTKMFETSASYTSKKGYFIDYDLDGGALPEGAQSAFLASDETYTLPTPTKENHDFKGWVDESGNPVTSFDPSAKKNLSVKATWEIQNNSHTVTYVGADGVDNPNPASYKDNDSVITLTDLSKEGYDFLGFYSAAEGGEKVTSIDPSGKPGDLTLYARWAEKEFAITYDLSEGVTLTAEGKEALPEKVKYSETLTLKASAAEGKGIAKLTVDGKIFDPSQDIVIKGSDLKAHTISATAFDKYSTSTKVDEDYTALESHDFTWGGKAYDFANIAIKHDGNEGAGLSKVKEAEGVETFISFKFASSEGKEITKVKLTGLARIFDYYGKDAKFVAYTSSDNSTWKALKEYSPTSLTDGTETVSLDYAKNLSEGVSTLYVKIVWDCTSGGNDWVVLKKLGIEVTETAIVVPDTSSEETSSEAPTPAPSSSEAAASTSEAPTPASSTTPTPSSSEKGSEGEKKSGCGGEIIGVGVAALASLSIASLIALKRRKDDK